MPPDHVAWNREQLYQEIWQRPTLQVAKDYGISDVMLSKICRQLNVPKPPRGYWRKKERGIPVSKLPLPKMTNPPRIVSSIRGRDEVALETQRLPVVVEAKVREHQAENAIVVGEALSEPHPAVAKALRSLLHGHQLHEGYVEPRAKGDLDIRVSRSSLDRATRIMDALLKAPDSRGYTVKVNEDGPETTTVLIDGVSIRFGLDEEFDCQPRTQSAAEQRRNPYPYWRGKEKNTYAPTGRLALRVRDEIWWSGERKSWGDGKKRLEERLNDFIVGAVRLAQLKKARRIEKKAKEAAALARARLRQVKLQGIRDEESRISQLESAVERWHKSERIRAYIDAVRTAHVKAHGPIQAGGELHLWLRWATAQADRLDPIVRSPHSILDEKDEWNRFW